MTFLTILGIIKILCSFRLILEKKTGKEIPESPRLKFLEKFLANKSALSNAQENSSVALDRRGTADLPFLRTLFSNSSKVQRNKFMQGDGLFCFSSIHKFGSFKNPFATITTSLSELYFRFS